MNHIKRKLAAREPIFGMLVTMPSPHLTQTLAAAGLDWLMIDLEHGAIGLDSLHPMIAATAGTNCLPLARIPLGNPELAKPVLDSGAYGIVFPMICSGEEAAQASSLMRYPPQGKRGVGPIFAPQRWGMTFPEYIAAANEDILTFMLIEDIRAVENIDAILATPGLDVALIAPFDLSASLGEIGNLEHPRVREAIARAEETVLASNVALGGLALNVADARAKLDRGYRALLLGYDVRMITTHVTESLAALR